MLFLNAHFDTFLEKQCRGTELLWRILAFTHVLVNTADAQMSTPSHLCGKGLKLSVWITWQRIMHAFHKHNRVLDLRKGYPSAVSLGLKL